MQGPNQQMRPKAYQLAKRVFQNANSNDRYLIAFSAGPDSVFLATLFAEYLGTEQVGLCYVNHQIRENTQIENDIAILKDCAAAQSYQYYIEEVNVPAHAKSKALSIEEAARELRYQSLCDIATTHGYSRVITAHHADDQAETLLFQLLRGAQHHLSGMAEFRDLCPSVQLWRPLLSIPKSEILDYLSEQNIPYAKDTSNESLDYTRNRIRHQLIPPIRDLNPNYLETLADFGAYQREISEYIEGELVETLQELQRSKGGGEMNRHCFTTLAPVLQRSLFQLIWKSLTAGQYRPNRKQTQIAIDIINSTSGERKSCPLQPPYQFIRDKDGLFFKIQAQ